MLPLSNFSFLNRRLDSKADCEAIMPTDVASVAAIVARVKDETTKALESIYTTGSATYENTVQAADRAAGNLAAAASAVEVMKHTSREKEMRKASAEAAVELEKFMLDSFKANKKLYDVLNKLPEGERGSNAQQRYYFEEALNDFRLRGMDLPEEKAARVSELYKEIAELDTQFQTAIAEDNRKVIVPVAQGAGLPPALLESIKRVTRDDGVECLELGMDYPTYFGVMKNCTVASTRKQMLEAFENRAYPANVEVLAKVLKARQEVAVALGFPDYAHVDLANKMAKSPAVAQPFLDSLVPRMNAKWLLEKQRLIDAGLPEGVELTPEGDIQAYDIAFCMAKYNEKLLSVNESQIQEYFPLDHTLSALYSIYEQFLDVSFKSTPWIDPDVTMMTVTDNRSGRVLGHVVLDLFPREGKYSHACCAGVVPPVRREDGNFGPALTWVIANFPKATAERPALFLHSDVQTFFHEFGHAIHYLFGASDHIVNAGYNCKMDFVELPSQMLEEWMWDPAMLKLASKHYKTGEPLPDDLIARKIESKRVFSGRDGLRQLVFGNVSLKLHSAAVGGLPLDKIDAAAVVQETQRGILKGIAPLPDSHFECAFGHLLGYGACYYGYMWSKVFALDVYGEIKAANGLLDPKLGRKYADAILSCGGGRDPNESLRLFLEREPRSDAFFIDMGL